MIVAHVGPPTRRLGGPPGYLHQLRGAALAAPSQRHDVRFPEPFASGSAPPSKTPPPLSLLTRIRRKVIGPKFYRPSAQDLEQSGGTVDRMMRDIVVNMRAEVKPSLIEAATADVIFTHDTYSAEAALEQRRPGQRVWMMCHGVMPMGLYTAWSWGVPEADWRALVKLPDVRAWTDWELGVWSAVDTLIIPCPEAAESFQTIDERFGPVLSRAHYVLSGASAPDRRGAAVTHADVLGPRTGPVGLYLGTPEPYRGLDALMAGVRALPSGSNLTIAVAGPDPSKVPTHSAVRALGRVEDVGGLLASVDFLINVNRFSLFDLSTIEATQAGKPLMLHAVGGNRVFEQLGAGCVMLHDLQPATIADCLTRTAALDAQALAALGQQSRKCWETQLTPQHMWEHHLALYDELS